MRPLFLLMSILLTLTGSAQQHKAPAPMFRDPVTDGAADPVVFYNRTEKAWWALYTQRRANQESADVAYCYGNPIGIAESVDNGASWYYRGTLDLDFERGHNTFWAPDVVYHKGTYHLFVTYIRGVRNHWGGKSTTMHYTSKNCWDWKYRGPVNFGEDNVIDITLCQDETGLWHAWYKKNDRANIWTSESRDLKHWTQGRPAQTEGSCEGPKVFRFANYYWMLTDEWHGMRLYRSSDLKKWERQGCILEDATTRPDDTPSGAHGDVVVVGGKAYVIYFTHPGRKSHSQANMNGIGNFPYQERRSSLECGELVFKDGTLECRRTDFDFYLPNPEE